MTRHSIATWLFLLAFLTGCWDETPTVENAGAATAETILHRGVTQIEAGEYEKALDTLAEVGRLDGFDDYFVQVLRADALRNLRRLSEAQRALEVAINVMPGNLRDYVNLAEVLFEQDHVDGAIDVLEKAHIYLYPPETPFKDFSEVNASISSPEEVRYFYLLMGLNVAKGEMDTAREAIAGGLLRNTSSVLLFEKTIELMNDNGESRDAELVVQNLCPYLLSTSKYCADPL